jgi:hypothetical protein
MRGARWQAALTAGLAGLALAAPAAPAATVRAEQTRTTYDAAYRAAPGEANRLTVGRTADRIHFGDLGALVVPDDPHSTRCVAAAHDALCDGPGAAGYLRLLVDLGDGDDTLSVDRSDPLVAAGGPGADTLRSGAGGDELSGGPGDDRLDGGAGDDALTGGAGTDDLAGGAGEDFVRYDDATGPVTVSLDGTRNDGAAGENDFVRADVEGAGGGPYGGRVTGNDGPNVLGARGGDTTLDGGGGDDRLNGADTGRTVLIGGAGQDFFAPGWGDNTVEARDGERDQVLCSVYGYDRVHADAQDYINNAPYCEEVVVG